MYATRAIESSGLYSSSLSAKRLSEVLSSPRQSLRNAAGGTFKKVLPGVVVTSSRSSRRRTSSAAATQAFAVAISGESPKVNRNERLANSSGKRSHSSFHGVCSCDSPSSEFGLAATSDQWQSARGSDQGAKDQRVQDREHRFDDARAERYSTLANEASSGKQSASVDAHTCLSLGFP